jgi:dUTP pyrophosphatase
MSNEYRFFKKLTKTAKIPTQATKESAGVDFYADEEKVIQPNESALVKTGITAFFQPNEVLLLFCRSGSALKANVTLQNAVGVIDSDYFGKDIGFIIRNEGDRPLYIWKGDRIGQGICFERRTFKNAVVRDQEREGGFGSTSLSGKET